MVSIEVTAVGGQSRRFSLVPEMASAGFLLSPLVPDVSWFSWLASTPWSDANWQRAISRFGIRTVTLGTEGPWGYEPEFRVRFLRVKFEPVRDPIGRFDKRHLALLQLYLSPINPCQRTLHWVQGAGVALLAEREACLGVPVVSSAALFSLPKSARQLRIGYGGAATNRGDENQGRVGFRVLAVDAAGRRRQLWSKTIDAGPYKTKTAVYHDVLPIDLSEVAYLAFETSQEQVGQSLEPFWFDADYQ
jgi:hypothetical protein